MYDFDCIVGIMLTCPIATHLSLIAWYSHLMWAKILSLFIIHAHQEQNTTRWGSLMWVNYQITNSQIIFFLHWFRLRQINTIVPWPIAATLYTTVLHIAISPWWITLSHSFRHFLWFWQQTCGFFSIYFKHTLCLFILGSDELVSYLRPLLADIRGWNWYLDPTRECGYMLLNTRLERVGY